ncbi:MAG: type VII toxin-antitoxin system MntA family adenylyltransferase antitoxin [Metallibacterium sp.]
MKPHPVALPEFIDQLRAVLARHPQVNFAMLFGSLARGTARPDSDLDLAVGADRPLRSDEIIALIGDLATASGRPVDLIDLADAGEPLLGQILAHGVRVLGDSTRHGALLSRHLTDVADFVPLQQRILDARRQRWIGR